MLEHEPIPRYDKATLDYLRLPAEHSYSTHILRLHPLEGATPAHTEPIQACMTWHARHNMHATPVHATCKPPKNTLGQIHTARHSGTL